MPLGRLSFSVAACLWLLFAPAALQADGEHIMVGTTGDYRPVTWLNTETGTFEGTDIDLIQRFARDNGLVLDFSRTSWPTLMDDLLTGKFALAVGGISRTADREAVALMSLPLEITGKVALVRCGEQESYSSLAAIDRAGVQVVENPGGTNERFARGHIRAAKLSILADNHEPFDWLKAGRADVMFTDSIEARYLEAQKTGLCAVNADQPFTRVEKVFLFHKDQAALRDRFNDWFTRQQAENSGN
ncbi:MAG: transporter substrate-binding domain-containing protein [Alphaproteobacteria bacterium]|nr:MAG: transporter substrate-binding domain-containing protein [Alphaproteobacteria bacterium]